MGFAALSQKLNESTPVATGVALAAVAILILSPNAAQENTVATKPPVAKEIEVVVAPDMEQATPSQVMEAAGPSNLDELITRTLLSAASTPTSNEVSVATTSPVSTTSPALSFQAIPKSPVRNTL